MILQGGGGGSGPPVPPLDPRMGPDNVYTYWDILKTHFIMRIGFNVRHFAYFLSHVQNFLNWRNILSWIPFGSDLDPNRIERESERESGTCTSFQENQSASTDRQVERERERERGVFLNFVIFSSTYFKVLCISLQKILIDEMSYIINGICADGEQAKAFWFSEGRTKV